MNNIKQFGKDKLNQNEKWVSRLFIGALAGGAIYLWDKILPFLINVVGNTLHLVGLIIALGAVVFVVTNPETRAAARLMYNKFIKKISGAIIKSDPIGVMRLYIQDLKKRFKEMLDEMVRVSEAKGKLDIIIKDQHEEMLAEIARAKASKERGLMNKYQVHSNQVGRLKESNDKLKATSDRMFKLSKFLKKLSENVELMIQDRENLIRTKETEYESLKAAHKSLKKATSIFNDNSKSKEYFEDALVYLQNDFGAKIGAFDKYLDDSKEFMMNMDIDNAVFSEKGNDIIDNMLEADFSYLFENPEDDFDRIKRGEVTSDELLMAPKENPLEKLTKKKEKTKVILPNNNKDNPYS